MIEPTDEMVQAYANAWSERLFKQPQDVERPAVRAGLAAVLAIVERDYEVQLRGSRWPARVWPLNRGALHPHYCVSCSDGHAMGHGCINCRQSGYDQTPWPDCQGCKP